MSSKRFNSAKEVPIRVGCNEDFEEIIQLRDIPGPGEININSALNKCRSVTHVQNCPPKIFFFKNIEKASINVCLPRLPFKRIQKLIHIHFIVPSFIETGSLP